MADERSDEWSIPVSRYPSPVCRFAVVDGTPVVERINEPFETAFGAAQLGTPVADVFEAVGLTPHSRETIEESLVVGDRFTVRAECETYRVETVPPTDGEDGQLVFTETTGGEEFGVENVASVVSHDLRNPLDVAKTRLRAGREFGEDEHFDHVAQAHERMERIIKDVLTLARGTDVVDPDETVALGTVASDAWETVDTGVATLSVEEPLPTTLADPDRVGRLFENLFRNCIEHGPTADRPQDGESGPDSGADQRDQSLTVTVGTLEDRPTAGFYVEDDGVGIPAADRDRVFEPGYSSDDHGTGLGLAIVARIADLHGWSYAVTRGSAGGARVEIRGLESNTDA